MSGISRPMDSKTLLKAILIAVLVFMIWEVVDTSLESSLFKELPSLVRIPWMEATLYDFYANVLCIFLWIFYKEKNHLRKGLWLVLLVSLGSIATCIYILKELFMLQPHEDMATLLTRQNQ